MTGSSARKATSAVLAEAPAPLRSLGLVELVASGAAFIAPAFSLAAVFVFLARTGGAYAPEGTILGTLAALLAASCFVAMSRRQPRAGGAYALVGGELGLPLGRFAARNLSPPVLPRRVGVAP